MANHPELFPEPERYELSEPPQYYFAVNRRGFLGIAGAGLLISAALPAEGQSRRGSGSAPSVAARVHIGEDGRITVMTGKVEVGQGSRAQISQAAAEELRVPAERIELLMADTAETPDDGGTAGSGTTPRTVPSVRRGAAAAREILIDLAAERWGADRQGLEAADGNVVEKGSGRKVSYAELAKARDGKAFERAQPEGVSVTPVERWQVLGASVPRPNGRDMVTGAHRFPSDIRRPGMLYGQVLRPPSYGATLTGIDLEAARSRPGVVAVRDGNFTGCAAPTSFEARKAVEALAATAAWNQPPHPSSRDLFTLLKQKAATDPSGPRPPRVNERGSAAQELSTAHKVAEARYETAYIQHAPMEPRAAVAEWQGNRLTVWIGTQQPMRVRGELAQAFQIPEEQVRVIVPDTGGGFGGKHTGEVGVEAARLAKAAGRPVSLRWSREEEFTWAYFRPAALIEARAGLDASGKLVAWEFTNINSGASALQSPYDIPHALERFEYSESPLREGSYRVLAATANNFARECFMDELAELAGKDPLEFRLAHLEDARLRAVLETAAERFRWRERRASRQPNQGFGLACGIEKGSYVAACAEVAVDRAKGAIRVVEVCEAFECGAIQNPANLRAQTEGCILMTLGATLQEEIRFEGGRILNPKFSQYPVPRFKDVPRLETILVDRRDLPSAGAGETPMIAPPPAVANAVFHATGVRLRSLPLRGEALRRA